MQFSKVMQGICGASLALVYMTGANAGTMGEVAVATNKIYFGAFGGGGSMSGKMNARQHGTAFFTEAAGGPLAVDAFGKVDIGSMGLVGGHIGYQWKDLPVSFYTGQNFTPAIELEGFYLGKSSFKGDDLINSQVARLAEHDFRVTYPQNAGVFLVNAIIKMNPIQSRFQPYIGGGIGAALLSISNASSVQTSPSEPDVNHYNSHTNATNATFAAQGKVGLEYAITDGLGIFAEYRGIYFAQSNYVFGSTVYPTHAATSSWQVGFGSQYYNTGVLGLHYTI